MLAGGGDELQGIKRGIMEMADLIIINKADGDNVKKAALSKNEYENALHLFPLLPNGWSPKVLTASALYSKGLEEVWEVIMEFLTLARTNGFFEKHRQSQSIQILHDTIIQNLSSGFFDKKGMKKAIVGYETLILESNISPYEAAQSLLKKYFDELGKSGA